MRAALPAVPSSVDYSGPAAKSLVNVFQNDSLGDCVIAAGAHILGTETGNAGDLFIPTGAQISRTTRQSAVTCQGTRAQTRAVTSRRR